MSIYGAKRGPSNDKIKPELHGIGNGYRSRTHDVVLVVALAGNTLDRFRQPWRQRICLFAANSSSLRAPAQLQISW